MIIKLEEEKEKEKLIAQKHTDIKNEHQRQDKTRVD